MDCPEFIKFCNEVGDDFTTRLLEEFCDCLWDYNTDSLLKMSEYRGKDFTITIASVHRFDNINCEVHGFVEIEDKEYEFVIEDGNWNGTVVKEWSLDKKIQYTPPVSERPVFVPKDPRLKENSPALYNVYLKWKKEEWFKEKERQYAYDMYFSPCAKTHMWWREWLDKKGLTVERV